MSKVKKEMNVYPHEIEEGDDIERFGKVVYINLQVGRCRYDFAYVDSDGFMDVVSYADDVAVDITREVEKPDDVVVIGVAGHPVHVLNYCDGSGDVLITLERDQVIISSDELIKAIKDVTGMD